MDLPTAFRMFMKQSKQVRGLTFEATLPTQTITRGDALSDYRLSVQFREGVTKIYDIKTLFEKSPVFGYFKEHEDELFDASVDIGGYGIIWNDDLDLSCADLWENGVQGGILFR